MNIQSTIQQNIEFAFDASALPGAFVVTSFEGSEALFECYALHINLASHDPDIDLSALIDTEACLTVQDKYDDQPRHFYGVITEAEAGDTGHHRSYYSVTLRPALHRLRYVSDSRIFQEISAPDIVGKLLKKNGVMDVEWRLAETHLPREFCVCYGERLYDFILRLLAEEGIAFWFEHSDQGAKLVLSDAPLSMPVLEHAPLITYNANPGGSDPRESAIRSFHQSQRIRATDLHAKDYTFKRPAYGQDQKTRSGENAGEKSSYALYQYPGRYKNEGAGKPFTKYALEAERVSAHQGRGRTENIHLASGHMFTLEDHPNAKLNIMHRLLEVHHIGTQPSALDEEAPEAETSATRYEASFVSMPQRIPYRPVNPTPKPQIFGSQIATVTGPAGEEIYTDEHGRVKLHFPWDRHNAKDENSSCWIRVTHASSGMQYGHASIPRIGSEVVVDYLDGDPDQPIVVGMAYNPTKKHAYSLPEHKTRSYWKDTTHKGNGFNEIRFESEQGKEEIFVHAQKDRNEKINHNHTERIDNNWVQSVGRNYVSQIDRNRDDYINGSFHMTVGASGSARPVSSSDAQKHEGLRHLGSCQSAGEMSGRPNGDFGLNVHKNRSVHIGGSDQTTVSETKDINVGGRLSIKSDADITVDAGEGLSIDSEKSLSINSAQTVQISSGESSIILQKDGTVLIKGKRILMEADEIADIETGSQIILKSGKISLN